jgi:tetratricopeptide (TPR) repeat protein
MAPDHTDNYLDFADIAFNHNSFQVGIDMLNAGLTRLPQSAPLYVARGVLEVQLSQSEAAVADFEQAHRLDPALSFAVDAIGIVETQQHQSGQSLALFESQARQHPDDSLLQYLLAEQLSESADESLNLEAAIAAAKRAAKLDPRYKAAHDLLAVLYLRAKQPRLAMQEAELALALDPNDQDALYQEIMARRRSGETAELPVLVARFNQVRKENARKQQDVDRYRLQDGTTPN